jgi:hypothetical protein
MSVKFGMTMDSKKHHLTHPDSVCNPRIRKHINGQNNFAIDQGHISVCYYR